MQMICEHEDEYGKKNELIWKRHFIGCRRHLGSFPFFPLPFPLSRADNNNK